MFSMAQYRLMFARTIFSRNEVGNSEGAQQINFYLLYIFHKTKNEAKSAARTYLVDAKWKNDSVLLMRVDDDDVQQPY